MTDEEKKELIKLAGECVKCTHYNLEGVHFELECIECKRFYSDRFEQRAHLR